MIKNKVVIKERDARSDLANFIGEMVAKYADAMELDQLPDPDNYLRMKRIKQLLEDGDLSEAVLFRLGLLAGCNIISKNQV